MTSEEIKEHKTFEGTAFWLQEIAYQLALLNEQEDSSDIFSHVMFGK